MVEFVSRQDLTDRDVVHWGLGYDPFPIEGENIFKDSKSLGNLHYREGKLPKPSSAHSV